MPYNDWDAGLMLWGAWDAAGDNAKKIEEMRLAHLAILNKTTHLYLAQVRIGFSSLLVLCNNIILITKENCRNTEIL